MTVPVITRRRLRLALAALALGLVACGPPDAQAPVGGPASPAPEGLEETPAPEPTTPEPTPASGDELVMSFLDVGQGDATLIQAPDATVLIDAGRHDRDDVVAHLDALGVEALDLVVITHPHADHLGQFDAVLDAYDVDEVWWSGADHTTLTFERALDALEASDADYAEPRADDQASVGDLAIDVVNPPPGVDLSDLHDSGLAVRVGFGEVSALFTGDAEAPTEQRMIDEAAELLEADVYQVGHHGSSTSSSAELLEAVDPAIAVYSAGADNQFGHPHDEVVARIGDSGIELFGTDVHDTVTVTTDGQGWEVRTEREGEIGD